MYRACIALVDATRARLFTFDRDTDPSGTREELVEHEDLVDPARRQRPSQLFSDSRPGSSRVGARGFAFDDHRDAHVKNLDAGFARVVVRELGALVERSGAHRLIVCASPSMLGELRAADLRSNGIVIDEVPRDLVKLTGSKLRERLAEYGLLPPVPPRTGQDATR